MKKVAIVGGSYLQLPAVLKAKEIGLEVHCFSWQEGAICADYADYFYPISIILKEEILEICMRVQIDGILTISSDLAVLTVNYVAENMGLISNPASYSLVTTNKYKMRQCFYQYGIPSPKFALVDQSSHFNIEGFSFPLIVKPTDRSGSRGVEKVTCLEMLPNAVDRAIVQSFSHEGIIEEYVTGNEVSVESISFEGKHFILAITDKVTTGDPYFVELEHHQPADYPIVIQEKIKSIVLKALDALHIQNGASHSELKIADNGEIRVIEIGARMGGDFIGSNLVYLTTGYDYLKATILVALGKFELPNNLSSRYSGVYFLSKESEKIKSIIEHHSLYPEIVKAEITNTELNNISCSADRSGYFIYQSNKKFIPYE